MNTSQLKGTQLLRADPALWSGKRDREGAIKLVYEMPPHTGSVGVHLPGEASPRCFSVCDAADTLK